MLTYQDAISYRDELDEYIFLIDNYKIENIEQWIIYMYAHVNSISKVVNLYNKSCDAQKLGYCNMTIVKSVLNDTPFDKLHYIVQKGYKSKTKKRAKY